MNDRIQPGKTLSVWKCLQATPAPLLTQITAGDRAYIGQFRLLRGSWPLISRPAQRQGCVNRRMLSCVPPFCTAIIETCRPVENGNMWPKLKAWAYDLSFAGILVLNTARSTNVLPLVRIVRYQIEVSATRWSLVQGSPIDCGESLFYLETSRIMWPWPGLGRSATEKGGWKCLVSSQTGDLNKHLNCLSFCKYSKFTIVSYFPHDLQSHRSCVTASKYSSHLKISRFSHVVIAEKEIKA